MMVGGKFRHIRRGLGQAIPLIGRGLLDLLYPPSCLHCSARINGTSVLCVACRSGLERVDDDGTRLLLERLGDHDIDRASAVWYFDRGNPLQDVQHALKYGNRPNCGRWMGKYLGRALKRQNIPCQAVVVPVPLHRQRLFTRGFNQSEVIGTAVADVLSVPISAGALTRPLATRTQVALSRADRRKNLSTAFAAPQPNLIAGRSIVLIDDVMTTGATLAEAAAVLKKAGAATVWAAAVGLARH